MLNIFTGWIRSFRNRDLDIAFEELRRRLSAKGYENDYLTDNETEVESEDGMNVRVILAKEEPMIQMKEIRNINLQVAKQFGLNPTGVGPVPGNDDRIFAYCGFRPLFF